MSLCWIATDDTVQVQNRTGGVLQEISLSDAPQRYEDETDQYLFALDWALEQTQEINHPIPR